MRFKIKKPTSLVGQLKELLRLFSNKKRWTNGPLAKDSKGEAVNTDDPRACKFCLMGGARVITGDFRLSPLYDVLNAHTSGGKDIVAVNEGPDGYRRVVATIKRAIKAEAWLS